MWRDIEKKWVPLKSIKFIMDMYDKIVTTVRTSRGVTIVFPIAVGLY